MKLCQQVNTFLKRNCRIKETLKIIDMSLMSNIIVTNIINRKPKC